MRAYLWRVCGAVLLTSWFVGSPGASGATGLRGNLRAESGQPLDGVYVLVYGETEEATPVAKVFTDGVGDYAFFSLKPGQYVVVADTQDDDQYRMYKPEYFNDKDLYMEANRVTVTAGTMTSNIDFSLLRYGSISGRVTDETQVPIAGVYIVAEGPPVPWGGRTATTGADGRYVVYGTTGQYRIHASAPGQPFREQYYSNKTDSASADLVPVLNGVDRPGVDFRLQRFVSGSIRGRVTLPDGTPSPWANVCAIDHSYTVYPSTSFDTNGVYRIDALPVGEYRIEARDPEGRYPTVFFYQQFCGDWAQWVAVEGGQITDGIDVAFIRGGAIEGTVTGPGGVPLPGAGVTEHSINASCAIRGATADAAGHYRIDRLPPGEYRLYAEAAGGYVSEWFDDHTSQYAGDAVSVTNEETTAHVDFALDPGGSISGIVRTPDGVPVPDRLVQAGRSAGHGGYSATTDAAGRYTIAGLPTDTYRVQAAASGATVALYYNRKAAESEADMVAVNAGQAVDGIDLIADVPAGRIAGRVTHDGSAGMADVYPVVLTPSGGYMDEPTTDAGGYYTTSLLATGQYVVAALPYDYNAAHGTTYAFEYYGATRTFSAATKVSVPGGGTAGGININLDAVAGRVQGSVSRLDDGAPIGGALVKVTPRGLPDVEAGKQWTGGDGLFDLAGIPPGTFVAGARFYDTDPYLTQYFDEQPDEGSANDIAVGSVTVSGIDFHIVSRAPQYPPSMVAPARLTRENPPTYTWTASGSATSHDLRVLDVETGSNVMESTALPGLSFRPAAPLASYRVYEARARGRNGAGTGPWSSATVFEVRPRQWRLLTSVSGPGRIDAEPAGGLYDEGAEVHLSAAGEIGGNFERWAGDVPDQERFSPAATVVMDTNKVIEAVFRPNSPPARPLCVSPANGDVGVSLGPTLVSSAFADADSGDVCGGTDWQIGDATFGSVLFTTNAPAVDRVAVPLGVMGYGTNYWRVRHRDAHGLESEWASPAGFLATVTIDTIASSPGVPVQFGWPTLEGRVYRVFLNTNLLAVHWSEITNLVGTGAMARFASTNPIPVAAYYRVTMDEP